MARLLNTNKRCFWLIQPDLETMIQGNIDKFPFSCFQIFAPSSDPYV